MFGNYNTYRTAGASRAQAAQMAAGIPGIRNAAAAAVPAIWNAPVTAASWAMSHPGATLGAIGAIGANYALGNPAGAALQNLGNMINPASEWDGQTGSPTGADGYNQMGGVGDNLYRQQLNDSMWAAERGARLKQELALQAAAQGYGQELGLQTNKLQAEREMQAQQLAAAQANQLLGGYINMIQAASDRAGAAASTRF